MFNKTEVEVTMGNGADVTNMTYSQLRKKYIAEKNLVEYINTEEKYFNVDTLNELSRLQLAYDKVCEMCNFQETALICGKFNQSKDREARLSLANDLEIIANNPTLLYEDEVEAIVNQIRNFKSGNVIISLVEVINLRDENNRIDISQLKKGDFMTTEMKVVLKNHKINELKREKEFSNILNSLFSNVNVQEDDSNIINITEYEEVKEKKESPFRKREDEATSDIIEDTKVVMKDMYDEFINIYNNINDPVIKECFSKIDSNIDDITKDITTIKDFYDPTIMNKINDCSNIFSNKICMELNNLYKNKTGVDIPYEGLVELGSAIHSIAFRCLSKLVNIGVKYSSDINSPIKSAGIDESKISPFTINESLKQKTA